MEHSTDSDIDDPLELTVSLLSALMDNFGGLTTAAWWILLPRSQCWSQPDDLFTTQPARVISFFVAAIIHVKEIDRRKVPLLSLTTNWRCQLLLNINIYMQSGAIFERTVVFKVPADSSDLVKVFALHVPLANLQTCSAHASWLFASTNPKSR
jgi:hypothetical protein